ACFRGWLESLTYMILFLAGVIREDREGQTHCSGPAKTERVRPIFRDRDADLFFRPRPDPRGPARSDRPRPWPVRPEPGPAGARRGTSGTAPRRLHRRPPSPTGAPEVPTTDHTNDADGDPAACHAESQPSPLGPFDTPPIGANDEQGAGIRSRPASPS